MGVGGGGLLLEIILLKPAHLKNHGPSG
jgi:hypothetical protein